MSPSKKFKTYGISIKKKSSNPRVQNNKNVFDSYIIYLTEAEPLL
jgi:hypothetical protein